MKWVENVRAFPTRTGPRSNKNAAKLLYHPRSQNSRMVFKMIAFNNKSPDRKTDDAFRIFENKSPQMSEVLLSLSRLFQSLCDMNQPPTPDKIPSLPKWSQIPNRDQSGRFQPRQGKLPKNRATWDKLTMQKIGRASCRERVCTTV